jgi:hypothetical protein
MLAVRLFEHSILPLSLKELVEGILLWGFGFYMGRKHIVLPMRRRHKLEDERHDELVGHIKRVHRHLGIREER